MGEKNDFALLQLIEKLVDVGMHGVWSTHYDIHFLLNENESNFFKEKVQENKKR